MHILATEKENMPAVTGESTYNLISGHERSGEGSEKQTVSQHFLQIRHNRFAIRTSKPQFPS